MSDRVMVFAPTPLLTVTLEQDEDGSPQMHVHAGGQGIWQARMVRSLGVPVTVCTCVGGEIGRVLRPLITEEDVDLRLVERDGSTGWYLDDRRDGERVRLAESCGAAPGRHELDELYGLALTEGMDAGTCVFSGPADPSAVPVELYRRLATDLRGQGATVVADLSGDFVQAAVDGGVSVLKISQEELVDYGQLKSTDEDTVLSKLEELNQAGAESVVISRSSEPALALLNGNVYQVRVPRLEEADHRGAGDSMTAGIAASLAQGKTLEDAVRIGAAAGALNVTRHGLGTGNARAICMLAERVELAVLGRVDA